MKPNKMSLAGISSMVLKTNKPKHSDYYCWEYNNYHCRGKDARYNKLLENPKKLMN
jgi:hypothetical protein